MTPLLYLLGAYVAVCWLWGLYLAIRLYTGRRMSHLMRGRHARSGPIRPLDAHTPSDTGADSAPARVARKSQAA
jgi:hypothetical protein